jgi:hypothetical protein
MSEANNGQTLTAQDCEAAQGFTAERVLKTRPKTYRAIVRLLANPHTSVNQTLRCSSDSNRGARESRAWQMGAGRSPLR